MRISCPLAKAPVAYAQDLSLNTLAMDEDDRPVTGPKCAPVSMNARMALSARLDTLSFPKTEFGPWATSVLSRSVKTSLIMAPPQSLGDAHLVPLVPTDYESSHDMCVLTLVARVWPCGFPLRCGHCRRGG